MKHIYVSPHSDDVALSCGGRILANPARSSDTLILNIFTSEQIESGADAGAVTFADAIHAHRTDEDRLAWEYAGVDAHYANLPEALLRKEFPFAILPRARAIAVADRVSEVVASYIRHYPDARFYFPAGFGNHVDHLACQQAAFGLLDAGTIDTIFLYEDVPYAWLKFIRDRRYRQLLRTIALDGASMEKASRRGGEGWAGYLNAAAVPFPRGRKLFSLIAASLSMRNIVDAFSKASPLYRGTITDHVLSSEDLLRKKELVFRYMSQIPMLFGTEPDATLHKHHAAFATETIIEVAKVDGPR